jgi:hypothetical protein
VLVSEILDRTYSEWLWPAGVDRPAVDYLASGMTPASPDVGGTFTLAGDQSFVAPSSILEIGSELIQTRQVAAGTVTVAARGYLDTTPANHDIGDQVRIDTKYPRKTLFDHLLSVIGKLKPWGLYVKATDTTQTFTLRQVIALPAGAERVMAILVRDSGSLERYTRLRFEGRDWTLYTEFDPPKIQLHRGGGEGNAMTIVYAKDFTRPDDEADDLNTSGVPLGVQEYLPMAVAGTALQSREIPRVQIEEIRRMLATNGIQVGTALNVGQAMIRAFRLDYVMAERRRQSEEDPMTFSWVRTE